MPQFQFIWPDPPVIHEASTRCTDPHCIALYVNNAPGYYQQLPGRIPDSLIHSWSPHDEAWFFEVRVADETDPWGRYNRIRCNSVPPPAECQCWSCEHEARLDNGDYCDCSECHPDPDDIPGIESYSYKPMPRFFGFGPTYLGVELELEYNNGSGYDGFHEAVDTTLRVIGDRAYLKEDGSINYGFELVTHPHDLDAHHDGMNWQRVMRELSRAGMKAADNCGMHVHVSRAGFASPRHAYLWQSLIYRNQATVTKVARRNSTEWAAWPSDSQRRQEVPIVAKHIRNTWEMRRLIAPDRYRAINVYPDNTFEMRVFASTTNHQELLAGVELVAASVEYTRGLKSNDVLKRHALSGPAFTDYVKGHESYSHLAHVV